MPPASDRYGGGGGCASQGISRLTFLAEDLGVLLAELGHGYAAEFRDLLFNRDFHFCLPLISVF